MKHTKSELMKNHMGCKKFDCYDEMEIELVDLLRRDNKKLLLENKQLQNENADLQSRLSRYQTATEKQEA